tara:strand:- start:1750 stop:2103 length:354 start_codon:yes stop_codon:yes gene_type:complete
MKLTKAKLQEIILEELNEMYVTDIAGSDEDRAIDRHRADKRARGEYPPRPASAIPYEDTVSPESREQAHTQAMVSAVQMILKMNPGATLAVDSNTYSAVEQMAPELLNNLTMTGGRK